MYTQARFPCLPEPDPQPRVADQVRDRVALRAQRLDARFPQAVDLEAEVLAEMWDELRGVASSLSGTHAPEHFRAALRGERSLPLGDLCRLATDPTREARAAALAGVAVMAHALGQVLTPMHVHPGSLVDSAITAARIATDALGDVTRAVADGADAAEELRKRAGELKRAAAAFESAAITAEARK